MDERRNDAKQRQLDAYRIDTREQTLTTDQGVPIADTDNSLRLGERGPTLLEDFHLREKLTRFDHERIPERVVHARGVGAYGYFQPYASLRDVTAADFLSDSSLVTPVFVRFSTVGGSRGSADTVRDVRGFAVKFYTRAGNFDLVGNNMPVFFIQDGAKFPDFVHAVKPEPHNEIPQASSAHDTLWDFVRLQPETMHMILWLMSDRALPRSYRMMQGFGVHTFRLVNAEGVSTFVKFHWRPLQGTYSLVWDEVQRIAGADPDFNRRDLWESIEDGAFPQWELGVQLIPEERRFDFGVDLLDPTKIVPEELVPVRPVGRMVLDRNPENFFAETEQAAFHVANVVPGIDVTDDPLMQARLFSYLDTQLIRLGGPNFPRIPVNQPVAPVANNQRDGYHQDVIHPGRSSYEKNSTGGGYPAPAGAEGGYTSFPERAEGVKLRRRAETFADHYTQAALFWRSMADWEQRHIVSAFRFELGKVERREIAEDVVGHLARVDRDLATRVGEGLGIEPPDVKDVPALAPSPALSIDSLKAAGIATRRVAVLAADGVPRRGLVDVRRGLEFREAVCELVAPHGGDVPTADGEPLAADRALPTVGSVLYDAVLVPDGGLAADALCTDGEAVRFVAEAYRHGKAIAAFGAGTRLLHAAGVPLERAGDTDAVVVADGVVTGPAAGGGASVDEFVGSFADAIAAHRHWQRTPLVATS